QALSGIPGLTLQDVGGRGEGSFTIRGSTLRQVGVYIDDIPVATAYRNDYDFNNVMVFDAESIDVSKGYSSTLLNGGFGLAGVLNVKTHKPTRPLEFKAQYLNYFDRQGDDQGRFFGVRVGSKQELFYFQVSAVQDQQDFFTLSKSFRPGYFENGGRRGNSDFRNRRLNVIAGLTPSDKVDITFGTVLQDFVKGQPVSAEADPNFTFLGTGFGAAGGTRLWRWPIYRTQRYYANIDAEVAEKTRVQFLAYYDKHIDMVESYAALIKEKPANHLILSDSGYEQYVAGLRGRFTRELTPNHKISWSIGFRELSHKEISKNRTTLRHYVSERIKEKYWDLGGEYSYKPTANLTAVLGLSYSRRTPRVVDKFSSNLNSMVPIENSAMERNDLFDWQLGLFYDLYSDQQIFFTYARKSRFPAMWERFQRANTPSYNQALSIDLKPEKADHFEIGYRGSYDGWLKFATSAFYSTINDKITMVSVNFNTFRYAINVDKAVTYGLELGLEAIVNKYLTIGGSVSFMDWETETQERRDKLLTYAPKVQGSLFTVFSPMENLSFTAEANARSAFYCSTDLDDARNKAPGFLTADLKLSYDYNEHLTFELGARNIFDKNYYYAYYTPRPGRTFFLGLTGNY
ncbi:MAG: TonB-dependent receptor, partial [Deltaproteobacteria bacterium]|nr:TonB-dependent receptor [Deltaproteobacteria bacterium]